MSRLLAFGPFRLDTLSHILLRDEQLVPLPPKAIEVLLVLVKHRGEVVSKNELMEAVWPDAFVEEGNLTQSVHLLRRALQDKTEEHRYILTVPGRGYCFVATVQETQEEQSSNKHHPESPSPTDHKNRDVKTTNDPAQRLWHLMVRRKRRLLLAAVLTLTALAAVAEILSPLARHFNNKGVEFQSKGELHAGMTEYRRALLLRPSYAEARYNLADAYEEIPDYEKAIEEYQKAIDSDVTLYEAYNNLARLYIKLRKDPGAALGLLDRGLSSNPQEKSVKYAFHKNYGWANLELRNYLRAEQDLRFAIEIEPGRGAAHCLLAKVLDAEGKAAEAFPDWETCLALSGQSEVESEWRNGALEHLSKNEQKE